MNALERFLMSDWSTEMMGGSPCLRAGTIPKAMSIS